MTEVFTAETTWKKRGKPAVLRISTCGHIRFSVSTVRNLGLEIGDKISFMIDYRDKGVVYFFKDNDKGMPLGFCTRGTAGVNGLQVCCRPMAFKIFDHMGLSKNTTFDITTEVTKTDNGAMWMILKDKIHRPIKWKKKESMIL